MTDELKKNLERLASLPELIAVKQSETNHREAIANLEGSLKMKRFEFEQEAGMVTLEDSGKKAYTNAEARAAYAERMMAEDQLCRTWRKELGLLESQKFQAQIEVERFRNELIALKIICNAMITDQQSLNISQETKTKTLSIEVHHVA